MMRRNVTKIVLRCRKKERASIAYSSVMESTSKKRAVATNCFFALQHNILPSGLGKKQQLLSFSSSTPKESSSSKVDISSFSIDELKKLLVNSLRRRDDEELKSLSSYRAQSVTDQLLERMEQFPATDEQHLLHVQNFLIDSWMDYQTSLMDEVQQQRETIMEKISSLSHDGSNIKSSIVSDESTKSHSLQNQYLREIHFAATSMTGILQRIDGQPTSYHFVSILKAWANTCQIAHEMGKSKTSFVVGAPQRSQLILSKMEPEATVEAYNEVIKAWAYSSEYLRGTMAEQVFQNIRFPTEASFRMIMRAHAWSKESRSAFHATGHFMRLMRLLETNQVDDNAQPSLSPSSSPSPSINDYHILCNAWTQAGDKNSSSKVYSVLQIMITAYAKGHTDLRPDLQCYRDALITMSRRHNVEGVGELADEVLKEMKEQMMYPDTECYRSAILTWKHVAMSSDSLDPEYAIKRTQELLLEMTEAYHRTNQIIIQPTTEDYNNVLQSLSLSKSQNSVNYAQRLFQTLKKESSQIGGPDAQSYRCMLGVWRTSRSPLKVTHAEQLLEEVKEIYRKDESWREIKSPHYRYIVDVFTAFVRVCGSQNFCNREDMHERTKVMTTSLRILKDMRKMGLTPNSDTYTALIEACDRILPINGKERQRVLEYIFLLTCEEGFVNQILLETLKSVTSSYLYTRLVVSKSSPMNDTKKVPQSWTRNVKGYREGNKVMPLCIHGNFTFTKSAAEYRMRKLRQRTNQKLLQGGRLKNMKKESFH